MDAESVSHLLVGELNWIAVIAVAAYDSDAIEAVLGDAANQVDSKCDVDDLLLAVRRAVPLEKFQSDDVAVRSLHCEESPFPGFFRRRRGIKSRERELVGATKCFDKRLQSRVAQAGSPECAYQVTTVDEDRDADRRASG